MPDGADGLTIQPGDVCLDLAQGRPVQVLEDTGQTAAEWSDANDYDLVGNYGNSRLGATAEDRVYDVVYCSSLKSEPSKTYAMPESRLGRVETEAADDGRPVADRVRVELLAHAAKEMLWRTDGQSEARKAMASALVSAARHVGLSEDAISEAHELGEVEYKAMESEADDA